MGVCIVTPPQYVVFLGAYFWIYFHNGACRNIYNRYTSRKFVFQMNTWNVHMNTNETITTDRIWSKYCVCSAVLHWFGFCKSTAHFLNTLIVVTRGWVHLLRLLTYFLIFYFTSKYLFHQYVDLNCLCRMRTLDFEWIGNSFQMNSVKFVRMRIICRPNLDFYHNFSFLHVKHVKHTAILKVRINFVLLST